jgi:hypothetical protein
MKPDKHGAIWNEMFFELSEYIDFYVILKKNTAR